MASGDAIKATPEEVDTAKEALATYDRLGNDDQVQFAKAFFSNKGNKTFGFVKDYSEKIQASKIVAEEVQENYYTRIAVLNVNKCMRALPS